MATAYRDGKPYIGGRPQHAFRTIEAMKSFLKSVHATKSQLDDLWEINGTIVDDDGSEDGIQMIVESYKQIQIKL